MAIGAPFLFVEATRTHVTMASLASFQTSAAKALFTRGTLADAARTAVVIATAAGGFTLTADGLATLVARIAVVLIHESTAVGTSATAPQSQFHKRTLGVVGPKYASNERKEI